MYVEVKDHHQNLVQVSLSFDSTFGDARNAVNRSLPRGFALTEFELVPSPFSHYLEDDPECFKGPGDEWLVADVFLDTLAASLRRSQTNAVAKVLTVRLPLVSLVPLGPPLRVGVLFPGERAVDETALETLVAGPSGVHATRLLAAASAARGHDLRAAHAAGDAVAARDAALVLTLANIEAHMCQTSGEKRWDARPAWALAPLRRADVGAVCGFGAAGETAALIFCGALTLEEGLELGDVRAAALAHAVSDGVVAAASVLGGDRAVVEAAIATISHEFGPLAVSHDLFDGALIVGGARSAVDAFGIAAAGPATVRSTTSGQGAHTPLAVPAAAAYATALASRLEGGTLAHPLYCAGGTPMRFESLVAATPKLGTSLTQPVSWRMAVTLMLQDGIHHFLDAGGATQLKEFMAHTSPRAALLMV